MKKYFSLLVALFIFVHISSAQQSQSDAWIRYQDEKKSEVVAGALEFLVPVVGHAYAGDAGRGVVPAVVSAGGIVLVIVGVVNESLALATVGYFGYLGGRVWGIVSAVQTAQDYNAKLRKRLNLSLMPIRGGLGLGVSYSF